MLRILQEQNLHAYHLQEVQELGPNDYATRVPFVQWFLQRSIVNPAFPAQVLLTASQEMATSTAETVTT